MLKGKVAYITGGNSGMGLATALLFAKRGAHVSLLSRREDRNAEAKALVEAEGVDCLTFSGDVSQVRDVKESLQKTFDHFGALHYAFNNAGVSQPRTAFLEQSEDDFAYLMDINFKGVWLCMKHQIPLLLKSGGGCIVNNSSYGGMKACPQAELYAASKWAVIGLTKSLAAEYIKQNIRMNAICPTGVDTEMISGLFDAEGVKTFSDRQPFGRCATPQEIAETVLWLCGDQSYFVTGVALALGAIP